MGTMWYYDGYLIAVCYGYCNIKLVCDLAQKYTATFLKEGGCELLSTAGSLSAQKCMSLISRPYKHCG